MESAYAKFTTIFPIRSLVYSKEKPETLNVRCRDTPDWAGWHKTTPVILTQVHPILDKNFRWIYISEIIQEDLSLTILHASH